MYVCLCRGVTDKHIQEAVEAGACSPAEVMRCTGAGTCCGTCVPTVVALVNQGREAPGPVSTRRALVVLPAAAATG